ncbi:MAG: division/cell wall cluster transcriptional repressor MraZ [Actinobacteria bacterium]|nr:division/cell wall cluster transcriptional repressor MraZ [Actinomycetota bacterium]
MFVGEYHRSRDNKGRVFIPAKFRENLIGGAYVSKGFDEQCLFLYPKENWKNLGEIISGGPITRIENQRFKRIFFSKASEAEIDQQGRIKIPQNLAEIAELEKEVVLVGVSERIEIWAKDKWEKYSSEAESKFYQDKSNFEKLGF